MRDSRRLEDPSPAKPEDAGCGATRSHIGRRDRGSRVEGRPKALALDALKDARIEVTRNSIAGRVIELRKSGKPGTSAHGRTGWCMVRVTCKVTLLRRQRLRFLASS